MSNLTPEDAKKLLETDREEREKKCREEIQKILNKYNCIVDVTMIIKTNQIIPQINIIAK